MSRTIAAVLVLMTAAVTGGCASKAAARRAATEIRGSLVRHETALDAKIEEQQGFYANRRKAIAAVQEADNDQVLGLSRRIRAMRYASRLIGDPKKEVRADALLDYLAASVEEDFEWYHQHRAAEAAAAKEYDAALQQVGRERQALAETRNLLTRLATKSSRKEQIQAAADFATELKKRIDEMNAKEAAKKAAAAN